MLRAEYTPYRLEFNFEAITSRGSMRAKDTYFIRIHDEEGRVGLGECALFRGLSCDDVVDYDQRLNDVCQNINCIDPEMLRDLPSIRFGYETALAGLRSGNPFLINDCDLIGRGSGIRINGLVWMGDVDLMLQRVAEKLERGFRCLKLKIGGVDFEDEVDIIKTIRRQFPSSDLELRLDANGAFSPYDAMEKLKVLSDYDIHSIEQPVKAGQYELMASLCDSSPIAIALDEELIGVNHVTEKVKLLEVLKPQYVILKPALCGGFEGSEEWIEAAEKNGIGWWATSALESNIGLNAIAQWCSSKSVVMPQGLGTGQLYTNNVESPLYLDGERLFYDRSKQWDISGIKWKK